VLASSPATERAAAKGGTEAAQQGKNKSQLEEFQAVMGTRRSSRPSWAADVDLGPTPGPKPAEPSRTEPERVSEKKDRRSKNNGETKEDGEEQLGEMSDMEWMRRKMQDALGTLEDDKVFEQSDEEIEEKGDTKVRLSHTLASLPY